MHDWEELNAPPPENVLNAAKEISAAAGLMDQAAKRLAQAMEYVSGLPAEDRIGGYLYSLEDLRCDVNKLKALLERGKEV